MLSTSLLLAASMVVGQADGATAAEAEPAQPVPAKANPLEEFGKAFVGSWESVWTADKDHDKGNWKAGDELPVKIQNDWDLKQAVLTYELSSTLPGTGEHVVWSKGFYVWNPEIEKVTLYGFGVNGNINQTTFDKEGDTWITKGTVLTRQGGKKTHSSTIEVKDGGNTHITHRISDGDSKKPMTWKR